MIRSLIRNVAIPILILALLGPTTIAPAAAKDSGVKVKATFELFHPAILAGKSLNPGTYSIVADETSLKISRDGKLIAEVPAQWKDAPGKAEQTSLLLDQGQIREIHFGGKTRFVVISQ